MNLYGLGREFQKIASRMNDVKNLAKGHPERVLKKAVKREIYKGVSKGLRKF